MPSVYGPMEKPANKMQIDMDERFSILATMEEISTKSQIIPTNMKY